MAELGVKRGLQLMAEWSGGSIAPGLLDEYPLKPKNPTVLVTPNDVKRLLGIDLKVAEIARLLERLEFKCVIAKTGVRVSVPAHRTDIGEGIVGLADMLEEIARIYGYDRIPETRMADSLPPQIGNPVNEWEEHLRDILVTLGFQEIVGYRLTSPEREGRLVAGGNLKSVDYASIANPTTPERRVLRRSLVASVLEALEHNLRWRDSISMFEIGPIFEPVKDNLPLESRKLAIAMTGVRGPHGWDVKNAPWFDFYDLKGCIELMFSALHFTNTTFSQAETINYLHPGKTAEVKVNDRIVGVLGELHPIVKANYEMGDAPVLVAEFDIQALRSIPTQFRTVPVPEFPAVIEDIALILDESIPAARVESLIRESGGDTVTHIRLFDVYRGEQVGVGKKSLAYNLTYQAADKTLTDAEVAALRKNIVKQLEQQLEAKLRG